MVRLILRSLVVLTSCAQPAEFDVSDLEVQELRLNIYPEGSKILAGKPGPVSHSETELSVAQIQFTLFDPDNRLITSMSVVVHEISAYGPVSFRAAVISDLEVTGARTRQILIP